MTVVAPPPPSHSSLKERWLHLGFSTSTLLVETTATLVHSGFKYGCDVLKSFSPNKRKRSDSSVETYSDVLNSEPHVAERRHFSNGLQEQHSKRLRPESNLSERHPPAQANPSPLATPLFGSRRATPAKPLFSPMQRLLDLQLNVAGPYQGRTPGSEIKNRPAAAYGEHLSAHRLLALQIDARACPMKCIHSTRCFRTARTVRGESCPATSLGKQECVGRTLKFMEGCKCLQSEPRGFWLVAQVRLLRTTLQYRISITTKRNATEMGCLPLESCSYQFSKP
eukprot:1175531-Prorocentrum_minimum.AAC.1